MVERSHNVNTIDQWDNWFTQVLVCGCWSLEAVLLKRKHMMLNN